MFRRNHLYPSRRVHSECDRFYNFSISRQMIVSGVEKINARLGNIHIGTNEMQPRPSNLPLPAQEVNTPKLEVTTPGGQPKIPSSTPSQESRTWLLKPQHEIPPTPPPQTDRSATDFFSRRVNT